MTSSSTHIQRAPLLWLLLPMAGGLCLAHAFMLPQCPPGYAVLALAAALGGICLPRMRLPFVCLAFFFIGLSSYQFQRKYLPEWEKLPPREARLHLKIQRCFPTREGARSFSGLALITHSDDHLRDLCGQKIYFSLAIPEDGRIPIRTETLSVIGVISPLPYQAPAAGFDAYLVNSGINFRLARGRIQERISPPGSYARFCERGLSLLTEFLGEGVEGKAPEITGIFRAMLLGQKHELSDEHRSLFLQSGTMHLFAISGLHIAAIAFAIHTFLALLRLPRLIRFSAGLVLLWLYVSVTGMAASAVRAFIMVALFQAAHTFRLPGNSLSALVTAAFIVLLLHPLQLFGAGFQMSYGIVASLLLLGLPLGKALKARFPLFSQLPLPMWGWHHKTLHSLWEKLLDMAAIGLSALPFSLICGILFFNLFTPGAFFANLVLIPLGTAVIFSGFLSILSALVGLGFLLKIFNHAGVLILMLMEKMLDSFSMLPLSHTFHYKAPWMGYLSLMLILGSMLYGYSRNWAPRRGAFLPPLLLLLCSLLFLTSSGEIPGFQ